MSAKKPLSVSILIPVTSKGRNWLAAEDAYLHNYTLKTFMETYNPEYNYTFYIGYDNDDPFFMREDIHTKFIDLYSKVAFKFIKFEGIKKGHVTKMWNVLFKAAYDAGCDYFFQCGDDINFKTKGWVKQSIDALRQNNGIGLSGPLNNNARILTQAMVSRKHMDIFGFFFPEEIINWCCDDWYNLVYQPYHFFPLYQHLCTNEGGDPRYDINGDPGYMLKLEENTMKLRDDTAAMAERHKFQIKKYMIRNKMKVRV